MDYLELVERLRDWAEVEGYGTAKATLTEAADAIEALDRKVEEQDERISILAEIMAGLEQKLDALKGGDTDAEPGDGAPGEKPADAEV